MTAKRGDYIWLLHKSEDEQPMCLNLGELNADGSWHAYFALVTPEDQGYSYGNVGYEGKDFIVVDNEPDVSVCPHCGCKKIKE